MWGDTMEEGRCVSRADAVQIMDDVKRFIPDEHLNAYAAAFNRVRFEFLKMRQPEPPVTNINGRWSCGYCGQWVGKKDNFCKNCGREIDKS